MAATSECLTFMRLPAEIRMMVYEHLLVNETAVFLPASFVCPAGYHEYEKDIEKDREDNEAARRMLHFRNCSPQTYSEIPAGHRRQAYMIRTDRFRARCMKVTYTCINLPEIHPSILMANRQIYNEAAPMLYGSYTFDFDTHIEACSPFLSDVTPSTRSCIKHISIVKGPLATEKDFDRCEWKSMCQFLSDCTNVEHISLGIVAGKPNGSGWKEVKPFLREEIGPIMELEEMSWVREVLGITTLKKLDIRACIEHCPPPSCSKAMAFFVAFSASIDNSFTSWLTDSIKGIGYKGSPISLVPFAWHALAPE